MAIIEMRKWKPDRILATWTFRILSALKKMRFHRRWKVCSSFFCSMISQIKIGNEYGARSEAICVCVSVCGFIFFAAAAVEMNVRDYWFFSLLWALSTIVNFPIWKCCSMFAAMSENWIFSFYAAQTLCHIECKWFFHQIKTTYDNPCPRGCDISSWEVIETFPLQLL